MQNTLRHYFKARVSYPCFFWGIQNCGAFVGLVIFIGFSGCNDQPQTPPTAPMLSMKEVAEIAFDHQMVVNHRHCGLFWENEEPLIYFGNVTTYKKIIFFDLNGQIKGEAQVPEMNNLMDMIEDFTVLSSDSILYFLRGQRILWLCDATGNTIRDYDLTPALTLPSGEQYDIVPSIFASEFSDGTMCLEITPTYESAHSTNRQMTDTEKSFDFTDRQREAPGFALCRNFLSSDNPTFQWIAPRLRSRLCSPEFSLTSYTGYTVTNNEIAWLHTAKPMVYFISLTTGDVSDSIDFTQLVPTRYVRPKPRSLGYVTEMEINQNLQTEGAINRAYHDPYQNLWHISVSQAVKKGQDKKTHWSLVSLDFSKQVKYRKTFHLETDTLVPGFMIPTPNGLLISSERKSRPGHRHGTTRMKLFKFEQ